MEATQIAVLGLGAVCAVIGWFARELWQAVQKLKDDLGKLEVRLGTDYVRYDRLRDALADAIEPLKKSLEEIKDTLAHKADK